MHMMMFGQFVPGLDLHVTQRQVFAMYIMPGETGTNSFGVIFLMCS